MGHSSMRSSPDYYEHREVADSDSEGDDPDANPFGLSKPPKDKVVVLHPALVEHMSSMVRGRRKTCGRNGGEKCKCISFYEIAYNKLRIMQHVYEMIHKMRAKMDK